MLRLPAFFENLSQSMDILTAGDSRRGEEAWVLWKASMYGGLELSDGVIEYAKTHEEFKGAFMNFQKTADQIYPGWKTALTDKCEEAWMLCKADSPGDGSMQDGDIKYAKLQDVNSGGVSLSDGDEYAKTHEELLQDGGESMSDGVIEHAKTHEEEQDELPDDVSLSDGGPECAKTHAAILIQAVFRGRDVRCQIKRLGRIVQQLSMGQKKRKQALLWLAHSAKYPVGVDAVQEVLDRLGSLLLPG